MDYKKVGLFIKENRVKKGLTQQEVANELFVDVTTVSKWERGVTFPESFIVTKLCSLLEISEHELFVACEDEEYRTIKSNLKKINDGRKLAFLIITGLYLVAILTCFICNLAVDHTLSWFWIVLTSCLCGWTFFPTGVRFFKNYKLEGFIVSTFVSMLILFLTCSIYTNNYWCFIAILGTLFGYFLFFFPFISFKKEYIKIPNQFFFLTYCVVSLLLTVGLLFVTNAYASFNVIMALKITLYSFVPFILAGAIGLLRINKLLKSSLIVLESGLFCFGLNYVLNTLLNPSKSNLYKIDFSNWDMYNDGNVSFLIVLISFIIFLILFTIGLLNLKKQK